MSTLDKVLRAQELYRIGVSRYSLPSLDAPLDATDPDGATLVDALPAEGPSPEAEAVRADLRAKMADRMLRRLDDRERAVLGLRFTGWTLHDVGRACGISRERVRQIEAGAEEKLVAEVWPAPSSSSPGPPGRPRREPLGADPRHARMVELWDALRRGDLLPHDRRRLEAEHRELAAALRDAEREGAQ